MKTSITKTYEEGLFKLSVEQGYKFYFEALAEKPFERSQEQVLAIMECQYDVLGKLIKIVKENA